MILTKTFEKMRRIFFLFILLLYVHLSAYESEDKLKVVIAGKVAKYTDWENKNYSKFKITILHNPYNSLFDETFLGKKIKDKEIEIEYINSLDELQETNMLYISTADAKELETILKQVQGKGILTVSDIRGFAEKEGIIQIYFVSQKVKLKINLDVARRENLKISSSLLNIATVIKKEE